MYQYGAVGGSFIDQDIATIGKVEDRYSAEMGILAFLSLTEKLGCPAREQRLKWD